MTDHDRDRLARQQAALLRALVTDEPGPDGFAPDRLAAQAEVLLAKRQRIITKLRPDLAAELGVRFGVLFRTYASANPRLTETRAREDAANFCQWLVTNNEIQNTRNTLRRRWAKLTDRLRRLPKNAQKYWSSL